MQYAEPLLDTYASVARLAERGVDGEKVNAERQRAKMQAQYPGIEYQSRLLEKEREQETRPAPGPGAFDASNGAFGGSDRAARWGRWATMAETAFSWAQDVVGDIATAEYARQCAAQLVEVRSRSLRSDTYQVAARISLNDLRSCAHHLDPAQQQIFAQQVGAAVAESVLRALQGE